MLGLLAQRRTDAAETVKLPLRVQDGSSQVGRIPVLRLPPLDRAAP